MLLMPVDLRLQQSTQKKYAKVRTSTRKKSISRHFRKLFFVENLANDLFDRNWHPFEGEIKT